MELLSPEIVAKVFEFGIASVIAVLLTGLLRQQAKDHRDEFSRLFDILRADRDATLGVLTNVSETLSEAAKALGEMSVHLGILQQQGERMAEKSVQWYTSLMAATVGSQTGPVQAKEVR